MESIDKQVLPTPAPGPGEVYDVELVVADQIKQLYANLPLSQGIALLNAFILAGVQWSMIDTGVLLAWLLVFCAATFARLGLGYAFRRTSPSSPEIYRWRDYFVIGCATSGILWGSAAIFLYPPESEAHQVFTAFALAGMVAGAVTTLTPVYSAFMLFTIAVMVPLIIRFLHAGNVVHYAMAGMSFLFLIAMIAIGRQINRTIANSLNLRFENHHLIRELTRAKRRAEAFSEELLIANQNLQKSHEQLEHKVAERTAQLSKVNAELETYAIVASHDLQEPLRTIANFVDLLGTRHRDKFDQEANEFFGFIVSAVNRMRQLIDGLLAFSRAGANLQAMGTVDCEVLLQGVLADLKAVIEERQAVVTHDPLPAVIADSLTLKQVFLNLLSNAFKFYGPAAPQVHVGASCDETDWIFSVRDNGIGIDRQYHGHIFDLFERLHGTGKYPGTGIGLAVSKKVVEAHEGRIWVESEEGQGATFFFTLPRAGKGSDDR